MMKLFLGIVCAAVLAVILSLGLWPFHAPKNEVAWISGRPGLTFGRVSGAIGSAAMPTPASGGAGGSIEIWLRPWRIWDSSTLLAFSRPEVPYQLSFRQSQLDLEIRTGGNRVYVGDFFPRSGSLFLTIASGPTGTAVYRDGKLVRALARPRLTARDFSGQLVVADSAGQTDSWQGQLFGLAVYHRELTPAEVARHHLSWTKRARPEIADGEGNAALYLFHEGAGDIVYNAVAPGPDLLLPERYTVADKIALEPFWKEFNLSMSYWDSALQNVVGFVPVGFCFYPWFLALRLKRPALAAVLTGTAISLTIEVTQAFLPTRDSGTTDLFTNTFGTWLGVAGYRALRPLLRAYGLPD